MGTKREGFVDVAKGLGVILIILGHLTETGQYGRLILYSFIIPFFFILSGVFAKTSNDFGRYFKKSFKRLYVPFFTYSLLDLFLRIVYAVYKGRDVVVKIKIALTSLFGLGFDIENRPLWFLFALFIIQIAYYFIGKNKWAKLCAALVGIAFLAVHKATGFYTQNLWLVAIPCVPFYLLGTEVKELVLTLPSRLQKNKRMFVFAVALMTVVLVVLSVFNGNVNVHGCEYGNFVLLFIFNALLGTFVMLCLSVALQGNGIVSRFLIYFGQNTIPVMASHYYICRILFYWLVVFLGIHRYVYHPIVQLIGWCVITIAMIPVIWLTNRYAGAIFGKETKKSQ